MSADNRTPVTSWSTRWNAKCGSHCSSRAAQQEQVFLCTLLNWRSKAHTQQAGLRCWAPFPGGASRFLDTHSEVSHFEEELRLFSGCFILGDSPLTGKSHSSLEKLIRRMPYSCLEYSSWCAGTRRWAGPGSGCCNWPRPWRRRPGPRWFCGG